MPRNLLALAASLSLAVLVGGRQTLAAPGFLSSRPQQEAPAPDPSLYDDSVLHEIAIEFADSDWRQTLERMDPANPFDLEATLTVDGETLEQVGVRYKGNTSQRVSGPKKPFNLRTHAFVDGQDLWGYDVINLNNAASDPSMLREAIGYQILRDWMPVPQTAFSRVTVQGDYVGVYLMVEQINREMVDAWFTSGNGIVIKGDPATGARLGTSALAWQGELLRNYERFYEVKTEGKEQAGYEHLRELARALSAPKSAGGLSDQEFAAGIRDVLDVEHALWYLAGSNLIQNGDSYYAGHNYYLYETAREPRFHMLSWDLNMSFGVFPLVGGPGGRPGMPGQPGVPGNLAEHSPFTGDDNAGLPLVRRLLLDQDLRADYVAHYRALRDEAFLPDQVEQIGTTYQGLIRASAQAEPQPIYSFQHFEQNLTQDVVIAGTRRSQTIPGVLLLAGERFAYVLDHPELQNPDVALDEHNFSPIEPTAADDVTIIARVSGDDSATSAELRYRVDGGAESIVAMAEVEPDSWQGIVPAQREGREVTYVFRLGLSDGRAEFFPSATLTRPFAYQVQGVDLPRGAAGDLVLNELMAANDSTIADEAGEFDDWIELYNTGDGAIDLEEYFLSDDPADPWAFPLADVQSELAPGEYLLIWCDNDEEQGANHAPFALARDGESAVLSTQTEIVDQVDFGALDADISWARASDGGEPWMLCATPSPGAANSCGSLPPTPPTAEPTRATPTAGTLGYSVYMPISSRG